MEAKEEPEAAAAPELQAAAAASPAPAEEEEAAATTAVSEAPGDEATAEAARGFPSAAAAAEEPPSSAEGETEAEVVLVEERPEGVPEEPPAGEGTGEGPAVAAEEEEQPQVPPPGEEAPPPLPPSSEEAAVVEEGLAEEKRGEEEEGGGGGGGEAAAASSSEAEGTAGLRAPSSAALVGELRTSASFTEGDLLEPPLSVDPSRRISVSLWELEQRRLSGDSLMLGSSPESEGSEGKGAETEEQREARLAEERLRREELVEEYRQLQAERRRLRHYNAKLQSKLGELLNKGKGKEQPRAELEQHISDREQRYSRYLAMLEELRRQEAAEVAWYRKQMDALQDSCNEKLAKVGAEWKAFQAVKKEVAVFTMGRRLGGRQAAVKEVDQIQAREQAKENEMTEVRLEYIHLKHKIQKLEASLKAQEELAEGLHLIDFEQLKIENQTYNEKIEERNEELQKLRRKITNTVQIISQVKEKLQFVEAENQGQKAQLMAIEASVAQKREVLTKTKQSRDKLRMDNQRLQQRCGLLGHTLLLRDFENKVSAAEALKERLDILKRRHAGLTLTCKGIRKKLQGVTSFLTL